MKIEREKAIRQRCYWYKRENVVSYLPEEQQPFYRKKIICSCEITDYETARTELLALAGELRLVNPSAKRSLREGLDETLTLHQ